MVWKNVAFSVKIFAIVLDTSTEPHYNQYDRKRSNTQEKGVSEFISSFCLYFNFSLLKNL